MKVKRIGILTSGGDCCGLNAVIEAVTKTATNNGIEVYGFKYGYDGLYSNDFEVLTNAKVRAIGASGGSMLHNSNKTNLFNYKQIDKDGNVTYSNVSQVAVDNLKKDEIDCLIIVGGDGSMTSARDFMRAGVNVVCVPKTIDNDVPYTDQTFGYSSAIHQIVKGLEAIKTTSFSHDRIILLEVMGRNAGWLALEGGLAGEADMILIPEIKFDVNKIADKLIDRYKKGFKSTIICISEGASEINGKQITVKDPSSITGERLGGVGSYLAYEIEKLVKPYTKQEVRATVLGYLQRGGSTNNTDRILSFRYGSYAVEAILKGEFGKMVSLRGQKLVMVPITDVVGNGPVGETSRGGKKNVTMDSDLLICAKSMGIYFGD